MTTRNLRITTALVLSLPLVWSKSIACQFLTFFCFVRHFFLAYVALSWYHHRTMKLGPPSGGSPTHGFDRRHCWPFVANKYFESLLPKLWSPRRGFANVDDVLTKEFWGACWYIFLWVHIQSGYIYNHNNVQSLDALRAFKYVTKIFCKQIYASSQKFEWDGRSRCSLNFTFNVWFCFSKAGMLEYVTIAIWKTKLLDSIRYKTCAASRTRKNVPNLKYDPIP